MPRRLFKRYMPDPQSIRQHRHLRFLGPLLESPNLWHLNRRSVSRAMAVGLFCAFVPVPLQMLLAASLAVPVKANVPIAVSLVWLTNPLTIPPVFYCSYKLGTWILQSPPARLPDELSLEWITAQLSVLWQPFLLGSLVLGVIFAAAGYVLTLAYWRWWVGRQWRRRQHRQP